MTAAAEPKTEFLEYLKREHSAMTGMLIEIDKGARFARRQGGGWIETTQETREEYAKRLSSVESQIARLEG